MKVLGVRGAPFGPATEDLPSLLWQNVSLSTEAAPWRSTPPTEVSSLQLCGKSKGGVLHIKGCLQVAENAAARECKWRCGSAFHSADELPNVMSQDSAAIGAKEKKTHIEYWPATKINGRVEFYIKILYTNLLCFPFVLINAKASEIEMDWDSQTLKKRL